MFFTFELLVTDDAVVTIFAFASPKPLVTLVSGVSAGRALFSSPGQTSVFFWTAQLRPRWQNPAVGLTIRVSLERESFHFGTEPPPLHF
jgi:hypothetical protein